MKRIGLWLLALLLVLAALWLWRDPISVRSGASHTSSTEDSAGGPATSLPPRAAPALSAAEAHDEPPGALSLLGRVVDEQGRPVPGAQVAFLGPPLQETRADAAGQFSFSLLHPGVYTLRASDGERLGQAQFTLPDRGQALVITLAPGAQAEVLVLDDLTRQPVANARLFLPGPPSQEHYTDREGRASFRGLERYSGLAVIAEGYAPTTVFLSAPQEGPTEVMLQRGVPVSGRVLGPDGQPLLGARVVFEGLSGGTSGTCPEDAAATSDASGAWQFPAVALGSYKFRATHPAFSRADSETVFVDNVPPQEVLIQFAPGLSLRGLVVDADGQPAPGASVHASAIAPAQGSYDVHSDEQGRFVLRGLKPDSYYVSAEKIGATASVIELELSSDQELTLTLSDEGTLSGLVVDQNGAPLPGVLVGGTQLGDSPLRGMQAYYQDTTDASGAFLLRGLPEGPTYEVVAKPSSGSAVSALATAGDPPLRLVVEPAASLRGRVAFADGSIPKQFTVGYHSIRRSFRTTDGSFTLDNLPAGGGYLDLVGEFVAPPSSSPILLTAGETVDLGTITVQPGRTIEGTVRDERGAPVAGATIHAGFLFGTGARLDRGDGYARSDEQGRYRLALHNAYGGNITADHPVAGRSQPAAYPAGDDSLTQDLTLLPTASLTGTITLGGEPTSARLTLHRQSEAYMVLSGEDGKFRFERVAPGTYTLGVIALQPGASSSDGVENEIELRPGTNQTTLDLPRGMSLTISWSRPLPERVMIIDLVSGSLPLEPSAFQAALQSERPRVHRTTHTRGSKQEVLLSGVPAGAYTLCFEAAATTPDQASTPLQGCQAITLAEGQAEQTATILLP